MINDWQVQNVTNLSSTFMNMDKAVDISSWQINSVTTLFQFMRDSLLMNNDLNHWDVSNCTIFTDVFRNADGQKQNYAGWDIQSATNMVNFQADANMLTANYDATLIAWNALASVPPNINIRIDTKYTNGGAAAAARANLIATHGWTITDLGPV